MNNFSGITVKKNPYHALNSLKKGHRINNHLRHRGHERAHCTQDGSVVGSFQCLDESHETRGMKDTFLTARHKFYCSGILYTYGLVMNTELLPFFLVFFCHFSNAYLPKPINPENPYSGPSTDEYGL